MKAEILNSMLRQLNSTSAEIEASGVISNHGLLMAAEFPRCVDEDTAAAMSAAMLAYGSRTAQELERGDMEHLLIKGKNGYVLMTQAGEEAVLTVLAKPHAKLGPIFLDMKCAAQTLLDRTEPR
ncbi:MAG: roadblock/LC7 domain-containing protein [Gammaproteobacteria bacterium]